MAIEETLRNKAEGKTSACASENKLRDNKMTAKLHASPLLNLFTPECAILRGKIRCRRLLEASRYADFITALNYELFASDNVYLERQLSREDLYFNIHILSSGTTNCLLESETYDRKRDSFAAALAHNGIVTAVHRFA